MTHTIYTYGYSGRAPEQLDQLAAALNATVFDIRFSPRSRNAAWSGKRLQARLQTRYRHVVEFGNVNYKGGPIHIVDYETGKSLIAHSENPVILICVCRDPAICHRTHIARLLRAGGLNVTELTPQRIAETLRQPTQPTLL